MQFLGVLGERWPDCQIKKCRIYARRQKALKCRLCGLIEAFDHYSAGMRRHVEEKHPESIPTCSKCGLTHEYSSVVARHEEVCGLPSEERQARFVQHFATNPEARYNLQRSRNETKQCPTLAKYVNERRIRNKYVVAFVLVIFFHCSINDTLFGTKYVVCFRMFQFLKTRYRHIPNKYSMNIKWGYF